MRVNNIVIMKEKFESLTQLLDDLQQDIITFSQTHVEFKNRISSMSQSLSRASGYLDQSRIDLLQMEEMENSQLH